MASKLIDFMWLFQHFDMLFSFQLCSVPAWVMCNPRLSLKLTLTCCLSHCSFVLGEDWDKIIPKAVIDPLPITLQFCSR